MSCVPLVLVLLALMVMMVHCHGFLLSQKVGMHARIIATAAIYQKVQVGGRGGGKEAGERWERGRREVGSWMGGARREMWERGGKGRGRDRWEGKLQRGGRREKGAEVVGGKRERWKRGRRGPVGWLPLVCC